MTYTEVADMIESMGLPFAYYQFPAGTGQEPPFICFYYLGDNDFVADNVNYAKINRLVIELYTDVIDFEREAVIENILSSNEMVYTREETEIDTEKMHMTVYSMEVLINGE